MILNSFSAWIVFFIIYSVIGWVCETIWCSAGARKFINRGFMTGPWCPIYGFGAIIILLATYPIRNSPVLVFLAATIATSILEYLTGYILEVLFKKRWWDYSDKRINLHGRVCLTNSIIFGLMGLLTVYLIHPITYGLVQNIDHMTLRISSSILMAIMLIDFIRTLNEVANLDKQLSGLKKYLTELEKSISAESWFDKENILLTLKNLRNASHKQPQNKTFSSLIQKLDFNLRSRFSTGRLLDAFPNMKSKRFINELGILKEEWNKRRSSACRDDSKRRFTLIKRSFKDRTAEIAKAYKSLTVTRLVWVFLIGSIVGYIFETTFCLVTRGYIESRQGMLYGPFSQIYGFGAVVVDLVLPAFARNGDGRIFFWGALLGGLYEVLCSFVQEVSLSSVSWQYADFPFAFFGGRTNLLYMCFWGVLAIVYMKLIYPRITNLLKKISKRPKIFFTWLIAVSLSINMLLSLAAILRWSDRMNGIPPQNTAETLIDKHYPNTFMEEVYPNMSFFENDRRQK